ncbi:MAG TPA: hypothetical protein VK200_03790, partial [Candidatus Limnocylindrales bacterium]|nr:hypothetical protein [Candidatus Limnocylindrales bacterium]
MEFSRTQNLGAIYLGADQCLFSVWAPRAEHVEVQLLVPRRARIPLKKDDCGYHFGAVADVGPTSLYIYCLDETQERPDPASRFQPQGVHGPSQVIDREYP